MVAPKFGMVTVELTEHQDQVALPKGIATIVEVDPLNGPKHVSNNVNGVV